MSFVSISGWILTLSTPAVEVFATLPDNLFYLFTLFIRSKYTNFSALLVLFNIILNLTDLNFFLGYLGSFLQACLVLGLMILVSYYCFSVDKFEICEPVCIGKMGRI